MFLPSMIFTQRHAASVLLGVLLLCGANVCPLQGQTPEPPPFDEVLARAQAGEVIMQLTVGRMYEERGSYTNAVRWYGEAANKGDASGQFKLGLLHAQGAGVPRDVTTAVKWFELAAKQGFSPAQYNLGVCWEKGLGTPEKNYAEALKWYQLAAEQNDAYAQKAVGVFYEKGYGVKSEPLEAYKWYSLATAGGNAEADTLRKNLVTKFKPEELAAAQKRFTDYAAAKAANSAAPPPRLPVETTAQPKPKAKAKDFLE
jgi:TPR repeat protein